MQALKALLALIAQALRAIPAGYIADTVTTFYTLKDIT